MTRGCCSLNVLVRAHLALMHITVRVKGESVEAAEKQMHRVSGDVKQVQLLQKLILSDKLPKSYCLLCHYFFCHSAPDVQQGHQIYQGSIKVEIC